jgi:hypothetical protein
VSETFNLRLLDLLAGTARELVSRLDADASAISRAVGDVLIMVADYSVDGQSLELGAGYLVSDYPLTRLVLTERRAVTLTLEDTDVDPQEAAVLRQLGFQSMAMLPFELNGGPWGLVEVYRKTSRPFAAAEVKAATEIISVVAARVT